MGAKGNGLPDLPPEWGEVVIPDDAAELDDEATEIRKELKHEVRRERRRASRARWRRWLHLPERLDNPEEPSLLLPMLVLGIALLITLLSLLMIAWPSLVRTTPEHIEPGPSVIHQT